MTGVAAGRSVLIIHLLLGIWSMDGCLQFHSGTFAVIVLSRGGESPRLILSHALLPLSLSFFPPSS